MKFKNIIEIYEKVAQKEDFIPLVFYSSRKGMIDYKQEIAKQRAKRRAE